MIRRTRHETAILVMAYVMAVMIPAQVLTAFAASAKTTFSGPSATVGSQVKVNIKISSSNNLANADIMLSYDANVLELVSGASTKSGVEIVWVHGDAGASDTGTLAFTLQFNALAAGPNKIPVTNQEMYDSSSQLVTVDHEGSPTVTVSALQAASRDATLENLKVSSGELSPAFPPDMDTYAVIVDTDVDKLVINADATDDNANKVISDNEDLQMGESRVTCKVTAQDGETAKEYVIVATKAEGGVSAASADAGEQVKTEVSRRTITILPPDESVKAPGEFRTSTINIDGHKIKGWVRGADQEPQYCVVYGVNGAGEKGFYRYDMKNSKRTIQKYLGDPAASSTVTSDQYNTLAVQYDRVRGDFSLLRILLTITVTTAVVFLIILLAIVVDKKDKGGGRDDDTPEEPGGSRSRVAAKRRKQISLEGEGEYQEDEGQAYEDEDGYGDKYNKYDEYGGRELGDEDDEDRPDEDGRIYDDRWKYEYQMEYKDERGHEDRDGGTDKRGGAARRCSRAEHRPSRASQPLKSIQPIRSVKPIDPVELSRAIRPPKSAGPSRSSGLAQSDRPDQATGSAQPARPVQPTRSVRMSKSEQPADLAQDGVNDGFETFDLQIHIDPYRAAKCDVPQSGCYILPASVFFIIIIKYKKEQTERRGIVILIIEKLKLGETMTKTEEEVADFLLKQGSNIEKYSSRGLAEATHTSPAIIVRMCKHMGFGGLEDFKTQYIKEIWYLDQQPGKMDANFPSSEGDTIMEAANRIVLLYEKTTQDTVSPLRHDTLQRIAKLPHYSQNVYAFSTGAAINQAGHFREKVIKIGKRVTISNNFNYQLYGAGRLSVKGMAVIISYPGETGKALRVAMECKKRSAPVIALTSFDENSLTKYAAYKLTISTKENLFQDLGDFGTHLLISLLLDILYAVYFQQDYSGDYQRKLERISLLRRFRESTNSIIMGGEGEG